jgi:hypothetical protein
MTAIVEMSGGTHSVLRLRKFEGTGEAMEFKYLKVPPHVQPVLPIWSVDTERGRYIARVPISVKVASEDGQFIATNEKLNLFGTGASQNEALQDLCQHIGYYITHFEQTPAPRLIGLGLEMKKLYERTFVRQ